MSSSSGITSPVNAAIQGGGGNGAQLAQIIKLPTDLQTTARSVRLDGQIISQNRQDNSVTIRTDAGEVQVRVRGDRAPQVGQRVEIDVPAGRPPRSVEIRTAPQNAPTDAQPSNRGEVQQNTARVQPQAIQTSHQTPQGHNAQTQNTQAPRTAPQSSLPAIQNTTAPTPPSQPAQALPPDVTVRILSVPPSTANTIAQQALQSLPPPTCLLYTSPSPRDRG